MLVTESGMTQFVRRGQLANTASPIVAESGKMILVKLLLSANAQLPILVHELGIANSIV